jgi:GMP synthase-like glutamine amidotransferase
MKPIVCVRHEDTDTLGVAMPVFEREGAEVRIVDAWNPSVEWDGMWKEASGIVVFGGEMNADATDHHPYLASERDLLGTAVDMNVPVLGVCLGGQLLARALGAEVTHAPVRELGFAAIHPTEAAADDPLLSVLADGDRMFEWHKDTFAIPEDAVLLATGDHVTNQAFRYGDRAWGIQFHPEVTASNLELWFGMVEDRLEPEWGRRPDDLRDEVHRLIPAQLKRAAVFFKRFADLVREGA